MQASFLTSKSDTFAGSLDSRLKLGLCIAGSLASLFLSSPLSLGVLLVGGFALALSATKLKTLVKVCAFFTLMMSFTFAFTALIGLFIPDLVRWNPLSLAVPYMRMLVVVFLLVSLALSTPVQSVNNNLQSLKLPGIIFIPLSVAIRFIPSFMNDCRQIKDAVRLRPHRGIKGLWRGMVVPLVFRVFSSADDLSVSAELKGLRPGVKAVLPKADPMRKMDYMVLALALLLCVSAFSLQFYGPEFKSAIPSR